VQQLEEAADADDVKEVLVMLLLDLELSQLVASEPQSRAASKSGWVTEIWDLWQTPVTVAAAPAAREQMQGVHDVVVGMAARLPSRSKSNFGGWQSPWAVLLFRRPSSYFIRDSPYRI
jgi:hypothetical protein